MATTMAAATVEVGASGVTLVAPAASGGTAPYTYQWYSSTTFGFTPGAGNIVAGATSQRLLPTYDGQPVAFVCQATDNGSVTGNSPEVHLRAVGLGKVSTQLNANQSGDPSQSLYGFGNRGPSA
jgi:hypothetical protein